MTEKELEKLFLWSEKHKIAYTDGCLLSLNMNRLIEDNVFNGLIYSPNFNIKALGVFTVNRDKRSLSLENNEVLIYQPNKLIPPEWVSIADTYLLNFAITSFREKEFLSKTFLGDITQFRFSPFNQSVRDLYYSRYKKEKQVGDTVMYYCGLGTGEVKTSIMYLEGFEKDHFFGPNIIIKANDYPIYEERSILDEEFSNYFYKIGNSEILTVSTKLTPSELKKLNSVEGRTSCVKCGEKLKLVKGFMSNYSYCPKCE